MTVFVFRFANIEIKSVKFENSLFENCYFEDIKSTNTFFENCTIKNTVFYNTGKFIFLTDPSSFQGIITENVYLNLDAAREQSVFNIYPQCIFFVKMSE